MEIYETYKESGLNYIGKIPINWKVVKLKYIGDALTGITYSPNDIVEDGLAGKLVLRSSNIQNGKLALDNNVYVDKDFNEKYIAREGDILICSRNGSRNLIGKNIIIKDELVGETWGAFMTVFRTEYSAFVYYFFNSTIFKSLASLFLSSTINQLTIGVINNFTIAIPSKEEQALIAKYLDHKTAIIDSLLEKKEQLIQKLQAQRQAIINEAVTKGLNPNAKMKDSGVEWLGEIPEHWEVAKLKFNADVSFSSVNRHQLKTEIKVRICHYPDAYNNEFIKEDTSLSEGTCTELEYEKFQLKQGQVIITKDSESADDIGIPTYVTESIENAVCGYHLAIIESNINKLLGEYILRYLQTNIVKSYFELNSNGVTRFGLGKPAIMNLPVPILPIDEQNQIINAVGEKSNLIFQSIESIKSSIQKLKSYRQSIISEAVTGKIDVRDWQAPDKN